MAEAQKPTQLTAPIAFLDEGFSSDGAFVSGVDTDPGTPIICEETDLDGVPTPNAPEIPSGLPGDPTKTPWGKAGVPDEKWESAGLIAHDDDSGDEGSPPSTAVTTTSQVSRSQRPTSMDYELRSEFEAQALSRPRPTTPLQNCAIETFIATASPSKKKEDDPLKINLPRSVTPQKKPLHRRRSSKSWSEFAESMSQSISQSDADSTEPIDMFDSSVPKEKVPPSPVVHRKSSTDWISFGNEEETISVPDLSHPLPKLEDYLSGQEFNVPTDISGDFEVTSEKGTVSDGTGGTGDQNFSSQDFDVTKPPVEQPVWQHAERSKTIASTTPKPAPARPAPPPPPAQNISKTALTPSTPPPPETSANGQRRAKSKEPPKKTVSVDDPDFIPPTVTIDRHYLYYSSSDESVPEYRQEDYNTDQQTSQDQEVPESQATTYDYQTYSYANQSDQQPMNAPYPTSSYADVDTFSQSYEAPDYSGASGTYAQPEPMQQDYSYGQYDYSVAIASAGYGEYSDTPPYGQAAGYGTAGTVHPVAQPVSDAPYVPDTSVLADTSAFQTSSMSNEASYDQGYHTYAEHTYGDYGLPQTDVTDSAYVEGQPGYSLEGEMIDQTGSQPQPQDFGQDTTDSIQISDIKTEGFDLSAQQFAQDMSTQPFPHGQDENGQKAFNGFGDESDFLGGGGGWVSFGDEGGQPAAPGSAASPRRPGSKSTGEPLRIDAAAFEISMPPAQPSVVSEPERPESTSEPVPVDVLAAVPELAPQPSYVPGATPTEWSPTEPNEPEARKAPPPRPAPPPPRPESGSSVPTKIAPLTGTIKIALPKNFEEEKHEKEHREPVEASETENGTESTEQVKKPIKQDTAEESSSDDEPYVQPSASPPRMPGDEKKSDEPSEDWKAFLKMTDRVSDIMKQTQERLEKMKENTTIKDLRTIPKYMNMKDEEGNVIEEPKPEPEKKKKKKKKAKEEAQKEEWKDVTEIIAGAVKKEKEAKKPARPPPPPPTQAPGKPKPPPNFDPLKPNWDDPAVEQYFADLAAAEKAAEAIKAQEALKTEERNEAEKEQESESEEETENKDPEEPEPPSWSFEDARLPSSDSGFFAQARSEPINDAFATVKEEEEDPFKVKPVDEILAEAKTKAKTELEGEETEKDMELFGALAGGTRSNESSKTGSPDKPDGFEDSFVRRRYDDEDYDSDPLYDEDDTQPLMDFPPKFTGDGWNLMIRYPLKKRFMNDRFWKQVYVRYKPEDNVLSLFHSRNDQKPFQEINIYPNYSLSPLELQAYDIYGKIHTVKLQHVTYKERVGIRPGQIPKLVEGHFSKLGMPLEHAAMSVQIIKFGSLDYQEILGFVHVIEDALFHVTSKSAHVSGSNDMQYKQDEVQVHVYDEYSCNVDKDGIISDQLARVRIFCLAFITGAAMVELGLNDRRRQGKEVVRRKDIMPLYTDRWIRFESLEFHSVVNRSAFDGADHVITYRPMDACFFELMRFRVRPPKSKELPLTVRSTMKICGSKIEIRIEALVAAFRSRRAHQVPCEDIQIRFPVPEAWIYLFREERHWGVGSVHGRVRRPGKMKNIKDRLMGMVQHLDNCLIEIATGEAKYEHVFRSLVWRIPRLPEKHHGAYKTHLLRCRIDLSSFDLMPEAFLPTCDVEFTMPMATVSSTVVRSVSVCQHEDPDMVEKFVRYLAKYQYKVDIDYVQVSQLDIEAVLDPTVVDPEKDLDIVPDQHKPEIDPDAVKEMHGGYRIEFDESEMGVVRKSDSSSSGEGEEEEKKKALMVQIDMKGYGYEQ